MCATCRFIAFQRGEIDAYERDLQGMDELPRLEPGTVISMPDLLPDARFIVVAMDESSMGDKPLMPGLYAMDMSSHTVRRMCRQQDPTVSGFVIAHGMVVGASLEDAQTRADRSEEETMRDFPSDFGLNGPVN